MDFDRALIVDEPWISLILSGAKTWEMRSRSVNIRGIIGLIEKGSGLIVGQANLVNSHSLGFNFLKSQIHKHQVDDFSLLEKWNNAWVLDDAMKFENPIPYKHPQGAVVWVKV